MAEVEPEHSQSFSMIFLIDICGLDDAVNFLTIGEFTTGGSVLTYETVEWM